jgi:hypothetical protein
MAKYKILYKLTHASGELVDASLDTPFEFEIGDFSSISTWNETSQPAKG